MDPQRIIQALALAATVLFLMTMAPGFRWRRQVRIAALALYGALLIGVAVYVVLWLAGIVG